MSDRRSKVELNKPIEVLPKMIIKLKNGEEHELTFEEARELFDKLKPFFEKRTEYIPYPGNPPTIEPYKPLDPWRNSPMWGAHNLCNVQGKSLLDLALKPSTDLEAQTTDRGNNADKN